MSNRDLTYRIMQAIAGPPGADEDVMSCAGEEVFLWRHTDGSLSFSVNLNDTFAYACADAERITEDNIGVFEQAIRDVVALDEWGGFGRLFAIRVRKQLPLKPLVDAATPAVRALWMQAVSPAADPSGAVRHGGETS